MALKREDGTDPKQAIWSRRNFLSLAGWGGAMTGLGIGTLAWVRMMYPRVLFEPPTRFKLGQPNEYSPNKVSDKWIPSYRFWLIRMSDRFIAQSALCTHLGCTPRYLATEDKFKCPCHGSGFRGLASGMPGINFEGPAPRPLERFHIERAEDGQILVDTGKKFLYEKDEWDQPGAYLLYS